jgi:hypothetical protein
MESFITGEPFLEESCAKLQWMIDTKITKELSQAADQASALIEDSDYSLLWFPDFGVTWLNQSEVTFCTSLQAAHFLKPAYLLTPSSNWHCNLPGSRSTTHVHPFMRQL